jgi:hypothetical protein
VAADSEPTAAEAVEPEEPRTSRRRSRSEEGSSRGSSAAGSPFFADPGAFDPDAADEPEEELGPTEPVELVLWTPERIRRVLTLQGNITHALVGVAERDWLWLPHELDLVCGPLADHCNRVPALAALAHLSDDAAIAAGFVSYATRSWLERTRELQRRKATPAQPITGRAPDQPPEEEPLTWEPMAPPE